MNIVNAIPQYVEFTEKVLATEGPIYLDLETTGFDSHTTELLLASFHFDGETYVIDFTLIPKKYLLLVSSVLTNERISKVLHNAVFDWQHIFHHTGIFMRGVYCTMIAEQVIKAGVVVNAFGLDDVAYRRLGLPMNKAIRKAFIGRDVSTTFTPEEYEYSGKDAWVLEAIHRQQLDDAQQQDLERVISLEMSIIPVTARMEYYGVCVEWDRMQAARPVCDEMIVKADRALQDLAIKHGFASEIVFTRDGYSAVNTASNPQMLAFVNHFGVDVQSLGSKELTEWDSKWHAKGHVDSFLSEELEDSISIGFEHPILRKLAILKAVQKLKGTYIEGLLQKRNPATNRLHPRFNQCGAGSTGRFSSTNPK